MRKSLILAGMLSIGYAHAQEGRVGINTDAPKATIDIQPNANNAKAEAKTNEGILAPRLSKTRIANIETPVEGTLVYATDETTSPISAYTGANTKVAKITEKGYYFYNGTEWVKTSTTGDVSKWTNDGVINVVKLTNLSDGSTSRENAKNIIITDNGEVGIGVYNNGNLGKLGVRNALKLTDVPVLSVGTLINTNNNVSQGIMFYTDNITKPSRIDIIRGAASSETGLSFVSSNIKETAERLRIEPNGDVKINSLTGTGNRNVYADENGVLKAGDATTGAITLSGTENLACNNANRGKMNFVKDVTIGTGKGDAFAVCLKGTDGKYYWRYLYGGGGVTNLEGNFGAGL